LKCLRFYGKSKTGIICGKSTVRCRKINCEREKEIREFVPKASFKLDGIFLNKTKQEISAKLKKDFDKEEELKILEQAKTTEFKVLNVETKPGTRSASAPFTTSTLQQEASSRLGYNVTNTMSCADFMKKDSLLI
jgi:DNA topoisomerase-1